MSTQTITVQIYRDGAMCFIPVPFDPKAVFGRVRAPVKVTLNGYQYRSTIAAMGGVTCIPLRKSNREAAGLNGGETLTVKIELDTEVREVRMPADLERELQASKAAREKWQTLSYSHKREHVEAIDGAKKSETRARRVANTMRLLRELKKSRTTPSQRTRR
jgi:hypothetical protein